MAATIDVLVVDDSPLMQRIITSLLESDPRIRVVATAADGLEAIELVRAVRPDVLTMDIEMPRMDGLTALRQIMIEMPTPTVVLSGVQEAAAAVQALEVGAVEFVAKPSGTVSVDLYKVRDELIAKVKLATLVNLERAALQMRTAITPISDLPAKLPPRPILVAVAASTGGPQALAKVCRQLPADLPASLLVVQHMPASFTASFAQRLDQHSPLHVQEAREGQAVRPRAAYLAPGGQHMVVRAERERTIVHLLDSAPVNSVRPSADVLMEAVAQVAGAFSVGVVLTGMGRDGARGLAHIKEAGGATLAQDRDSCVVFGMPKAAIDSGAVDQVLPLSEIPSALVEVLKEKSRHG